MVWLPLDLQFASDDPRWRVRSTWRLWVCEARLLCRAALDFVRRGRDVCVKDPELVSIAFFAFLIGLTFLL